MRQAQSTRNAANWFQLTGSWTLLLARPFIPGQSAGERNRVSTLHKSNGMRSEQAGTSGLRPRGRYQGTVRILRAFLMSIFLAVPAAGQTSQPAVPTDASSTKVLNILEAFDRFERATRDMADAERLASL